MVLSEELWILATCFLTPMSRNSVLEEFRVRRFAVIQEDKAYDLEHSGGDLYWSQSQSDVSKGRVWGTKRNESTERSGVHDEE